MVSRIAFVLAFAFLFGGVATNLAPPQNTVQTVEAKKNKKNKNNNNKKDRKDKKDKREKRRDRREVKVQSYINPDIGLATFNPDVASTSECVSPDANDTQRLSAPGSTANNVHNDACLVKKGKPFDTLVSYEISGVGSFNACPDPDGAGPKTGAVTNGGKRCHLTGYQETGMDGDEEYHARINNTSEPGTSTVTFCADPENNGCGDAKAKQQVQVLWQA